MVKTNILIICSFIGLHLQAQSAWDNYRGNQQLTGVVAAKVHRPGSIKWQFKTGGTIKSSPVVSHGKTIVGSTDGSVYCLNNSGKLLWKIATGNAIESPALINNGKVYIGNLSGTVFCFQLNDGKKLWEFKTDGQVMGSPNLFELKGKSYILIGSYDFFMYCIDALNGQLKWKYELDYYLNGTVAIDNGKAVFGGCDGLCHIVDVSTGTADKKIDLGTYIAGSAAIDKQIAYFGDYEGQFYAIDIVQKNLKWKWHIPSGDLPFIASPSIYSGKVYAGNRNRHIYCIDAITGKMIWGKSTGAQVDASSIVCSNGLLVCNMRGDIMLLNLTTGNTLWTYELGVPIHSNPAIYNGNLIVAADDGVVYGL